MNNLFSSAGVEMSSAGGAHLDKFFEYVEAVKDELKEVERLQRSIHDRHEQGKTLHIAAAVRSVRSAMDADIALALKKAKLIKLRLESLDHASAANRALPGCGLGSSTDRIRTSVVAGLRKKLKDTMESFAELRGSVIAEYRETVERRYYAATGERPDDATVDALVLTGEGERLLQRVIREQGRGEVVEVIKGIQERHGAVVELERSLLELQHVFLDMSVLMAAQGEQLNDIESQVNQAESFVRRGADQLAIAKKHQRNTRKWTCCCIAILVPLIILAIFLLIFFHVIVLKKK